jgi:hypothetical protein
MSDESKKLAEWVSSLGEYTEAFRRVFPAWREPDAHVIDPAWWPRSVPRPEGYAVVGEKWCDVIPRNLMLESEARKWRPCDFSGALCMTHWKECER